MDDSREAGREGGQTKANEMISRAAEEALAWAEMRTQEGAEATLAVTGRLLAENPLSVEALQLRGVALHLLGRYDMSVALWGFRGKRGAVCSRR